MIKGIKNGNKMNEKQTECFDCGDSFPTDEMRYARYEPVLICENCFEERLKEDE